MASKNYIVQNGDVIDGRMATVFVQYNGQNVPCAWFKELKATMESSKSELPRLGTHSKFHKKSGWTGKGEGTMYVGSSIFKKMAQKYAQDQSDTYFNMVITNDDPTSKIGRQALLLLNCNFDNIDLATIDIGSDEPIEEELNFTFDGFEFLEHFTHPNVQDILI